MAPALRSILHVLARAAATAAVAGCAAESAAAPTSPFGGGGSYVRVDAAPAEACHNVPTTAAGGPQSGRPEAANASYLPDVRGSLAAEPAASAPADPVQYERSLRNELAVAEDPTEPALELAGWLCGDERHVEALAVVQTALERTQEPRLRVARAGLLRDVGRRQEAARELQALVRERGPAALHPGLLLEWAELEWIEGDCAAAATALENLLAAHPDDPWCVEHRRSIDAIRAGVARGERPARPVDDLLGDLRGSTDDTARVRTFDMLVTIARSHGDAAANRLLASAVTIGLADESPLVRARAIATGAPETVNENVLVVALDDTAPSVRQAAALRTSELPEASAIPLLLRRLGEESDPTVFAVLHRCLTRLVTAAPELPAEDLATPEGRARMVKAWRHRCSR